MQSSAFIWRRASHHTHQRSGFVRMWSACAFCAHVWDLLSLTNQLTNACKTVKRKMVHVMFIIPLPYVFVCAPIYSYITCILPNVSVCTCMLLLSSMLYYSFAAYLLVCCSCVARVYSVWCFSNDRLSLALTQSCTIKKYGSSKTTENSREKNWVYQPRGFFGKKKRKNFLWLKLHESIWV